MGSTSVQTRVARLRVAMEKANLDAIFIADHSNVTYMSGYTNRDSFLFLCRSPEFPNTLITDSRYVEQARGECPDYDVVLHRNDDPALEERLALLCETQGIKRLAFESVHTPYAQYQKIRSALPGGMELLPTEKLVEGLRAVKDEYELSCIEKACAMTDSVFERTLRFIRPGVTEREIEWELLSAIRAQGCDVGAHPIVVSGVRCSLPHGVACNKQVEAGDFITMDFGCNYEGYFSDMTRTIFVGKPDAQQKKIYDVVLSAHLRAAALVKSGAAASAVDSAARDYIKEAGYGSYFSHGLGHGVGLDIHELPFMNPRSEEMLTAGEVITIEPGIYLPGVGGVRVEDTVLLTDDGCRSLFASTKELICL